MINLYVNKTLGRSQAAAAHPSEFCSLQAAHFGEVGRDLPVLWPDPALPEQGEVFPIARKPHQ